jgi:hypothetical protein
MKKLLIMGFLITVLALPMLGVKANFGDGEDGNIGTGNFKAVGTDQVEMVTEKLDIELYRDRAKVSVEYLLTNVGGDVTVKAGFPCLTMPDDNTNASQYFEIEDYHIMVDNKEIIYEQEKGDKVDWLRNSTDNSPKPLVYWFSSSVNFKKSESKTVKITYESLYQSYWSGISSDVDYDADLFTYLLSTGATWKGPIKNGTINIRAVTVNPDSLIIKPANRFSRKNNTFSWSFTDLKPTLKDNITVDLNNKLSTKFNYSADKDESWYTFENDKYYFDFHQYSAIASSVLSQNSGISCDAANVGDYNLGTAWVEGEKGDGIGESLTITLNKPTKLYQIGIIPGYAKSKSLYFANNRVAELKIVLNDSFTITRSLEDDYVRWDAGSPKAYQFIDLGGYDKEVKTIKLIINKVYKGTKYDDTCISEVLLRKKLTEKPRAGAR